MLTYRTMVFVACLFLISAATYFVGRDRATLATGTWHYHTETATSRDMIYVKVQNFMDAELGSCEIGQVAVDTELEEGGLWMVAITYKC